MSQNCNNFVKSFKMCCVRSFEWCVLFYLYLKWYCTTIVQSDQIWSQNGPEEFYQIFWGIVWDTRLLCFSRKDLIIWARDQLIHTSMVTFCELIWSHCIQQTPCSFVRLTPIIVPKENTVYGIKQYGQWTQFPSNWVSYCPTFQQIQFLHFMT